jgi:hypothetical protein
MKRPFLMFAVNDHLGDTAVRMSPAFARGVWIDMLCLMQGGEPYGYLRRERVVPAPLRSAPSGLPGRSDPSGVTPQPPRRSDPSGVTPQTSPPPLPESGSLETLLPFLTLTPPEVVEAALAILETNGVFSRATEKNLAGVIYSRRMRREDEERARKQEAYQKAAKAHSAKSGARNRSEGSGLLGRSEGSGMPPHPTPVSDPPGMTPLRTRSRSRDKNTQTPPTPPSQGGPPKPVGPAGKKTARGRGMFDDDAIRRHAELMKGDKRK